MADETEILVHIAAPSTSTNDAIYRAFAQAYLDFEPVDKIELPLLAEPKDAPPSSDALFSPQLSFNSVWENIKSPALPRAKACDVTHPKNTETASQNEGFSQGSWIHPPSEVADSMPDNDISMDGFNTPTRILNYYLQTTEPLSELSQETEDAKKDSTLYEGNEDFTALVAQNTPLRGSSIVQKRRNTENTLQITHSTPQPHHGRLEEPFEETSVTESPANSPNHSIHLEEALGDITVVETPANPSPVRKRSIPPVHSSCETRSGSTDTSPSKTESHDRVIPSTQTPGRAESEPLRSKRPQLNRPNPAVHGLGRSISDILPRGPHSTLTTSTNAPREHVDSAEPLVMDWSSETQIVSIEPAPSNHELGPKPPAYLELFVKNVGMDSRYKPRFQAREMRPYERGFWLLGLDGWDHDGKIEAWDFLGNFIRRDSCAGWGTRACRDEQWKWIRLYGWEHIAGELYILLYVATYQRTKYMELTWYDGAGKELIIVGARAEKPLDS